MLGAANKPNPNLPAVHPDPPQPSGREERTSRKRRKTMQWYLMVLKRYAEFSGRSRRTEYWMFALFNFLFSLVPYLIGLALIINNNNLGMVLIVLSVVYDLAVLVPGLAVAVRRLHDTDKSGWWLLIAFVPIIGSIVLLVFLCTDGTPGDNQFGPNPKMAPPAIITG